MDFQEAVRSGFRLWNRTDGRASRSEYWWWTLFYFLVFFGAGIVVGALAGILGGASRSGAAAFTLVLGVAALVLVIPSLTVGIRRLHDTDRSGWWLLVSLVPYLGGLILLIFFCLDGSPGPNRFGNRPGGNRPGYAGDAAAPFAPTVRVPPDGMQSWPTPDPAGPATPLAGDLHLAVLHRIDDWAQVRASNGWVGWVDARRLASFAPPPPDAPISPPTTPPAPPTEH